MTMALYKGTAVQYVGVKDAEFMKTCIKCADDMVVKMLRDGFSLDFVGEQVKKQMDEMEQSMCVAQEKDKSNGKFIPYQEILSERYKEWLAEAYSHKMTGEEFIIIWFVNVATLLKLKVVENDNENGWLCSFSNK
jgi:hypothetical protein